VSKAICFVVEEGKLGLVSFESMEMQKRAGKLEGRRQSLLTANGQTQAIL